MAAGERSAPVHRVVGAPRQGRADGWGLCTLSQIGLSDKGDRVREDGDQGSADSFAESDLISVSLTVDCAAG